MTNPSPQPTTPVSNPKRNRRSLLSILLMIIAGVLILAFVAIQLVPVNRANPPLTTAIKWDSPQTQALAERACMDCHSNQTVWPWYSYVAPASWMIYYDVQRGRRELNFSTLAASVGEAPRGENSAQSNDLAYQFGQFLAKGGQQRRPGGFDGPRGEGNFPRQASGQDFQPPEGGFRGGFNIAERLAEQIQENRMPPANYLLIHPAAKLTDAEKQQLIDGLQKTFSQTTAMP